MGLLSLRSMMITVSVAEPASRGVPRSVATTTSLLPKRKKNVLSELSFKNSAI